MIVSVVIPTRNRGDQMEHTVRSLWEQTLAPDRFEIVLVDNLSSDDTPERARILERDSPVPLRFHRMREDRGPAMSRNQGARMARAPLIAFIDSDVELARNWLEEGVRYLNATPGVGLVTGKLLYAARPELVNMFGGEMNWLGIGWDAHEGQLSAELQCEEQCLWSPTANVMLRKCVFDELSGFDETFYFGFEDSDLGWRFSLAGWRCMSLPQLTALHHATPTGRTGGDEIVFHSSKNRLRSLLKNHSSGNLWRYVPLYLLYSAAQVVAGPQRAIRSRALLWNLWNWKETAAARRQVQATRKVSDPQLAHLFSKRLVPAKTLAVRRREERERVHGAHARP